MVAKICVLVRKLYAEQQFIIIKTIAPEEFTDSHSSL